MNSLYTDFAKELDDCINDIIISCRDLDQTVREEIIEAVNGIPVLEDIVDSTYKMTDADRTLDTTIANPFYNLIGESVIERQLEKGDHVFVKRGIYTHHGIYIGNGKIIHYNDDGAGHINIHECSVEEFKKWKSFADVISETIFIYRFNKTFSPVRYSPEEIISRARSRMNEASYDLLFNNCEHFARWCRCGQPY